MIRKAKKSVKILKEFTEEKFKEVKKEKEEDEEESELEKDIERSNGNRSFSSSAGDRTAPVIQANGASQLENTARTAPATRNTSTTGTDTGNQNQQVYSADYTTRYETNYAPREREQVVRPTVRAAGALISQFDFRELQRTQTAWQNPEMQRPATDSNLPEERRYKPKEDVVSEQTKRIDKRRRMF